MTPDQRGAFFRNEELFRLVAEKVEDFAVFAIDLDGTVASWNPGVEKLLGYGEEEFVAASRKSCATRRRARRPKIVCAIPKRSRTTYWKASLTPSTRSTASGDSLI
jgi:PAS domain-containing protein